MTIVASQCTYRCVVLPDQMSDAFNGVGNGLNAPTGAWCSLTGCPGSASGRPFCLNAPTGAWCSLTRQA